MPATLERLGLIAAMKEAIKRVNQTDKLKIDIQTVHEPFGLPKKILLGLFRVFQELLQNTIKHAGASEIQIVVDYHNDHIKMNYTDNGKGMDVAVMKSGGIGMKNMESRIQALEGTLYINKRIKSGFKAKVEVPIVFKENEL